MKFKQYIIESKDQKMSDANIIRLLSKNIKSNDPIFKKIALSLRKYTEKNSSNKIFLKGGHTKLMDELWYRIASSYEESEKYDSDMIKKLKKNFYDLKNKLFKNFKRKSNYFEEE